MYCVRNTQIHEMTNTQPLINTVRQFNCTSLDTPLGCLKMSHAGDMLSLFQLMAEEIKMEKQKKQKNKKLQVEREQVTYRMSGSC